MKPYFPALVISLNTFRSSLSEDYRAGRAQPAGMEAHCHRVAQGVIAPRPKPVVVQLGLYKGKELRTGFMLLVLSVPLPQEPEDGTAVSLGTVALSPGQPQPPPSPEDHSTMSFAVVCRMQKCPVVPHL